MKPLHAHSNQQQPWNSTLPTLLLLPNCKTARDINQIHARILTTGFIRNTSLTTKLILTFSSSPHQHLFEFARYIFFSQHSQRKHSDPFLWNVITKFYSHGDDPKQAIVLLCEMLRKGVRVDKFSFSLVLKACSRLCLIKEGLQVQCSVVKWGLGLDVFLQNSLINLYLRCGCVEFARLVFDKMLERDSVSWNLLINGYAQFGMMGIAAELFDEMPREEKNSITWNSMINGYVQVDGGIEFAREFFYRMPMRDLVSWNSMIDGCVKCGKLKLARDLFNRMPKRDAFSWASMIDGYVKFGRMDLAQFLFDQIPETERDVVTWNAVVAGYVLNGHCMEALKVFHDMLLADSSLIPDDTTLVIVLSAIAELGHSNEGKSIHKHIERNGLTLEGKLGVALIDMYSKCGNIEDAVVVFENLEKKSVDHWNAMIGGLAVHGLGEWALELFMEMEKLYVKPDDITFIGVLTACGHAGMVKEGFMCFELMRRVHCMKPKLQHYGCMVDILGRAGYLDEARKLIDHMPIEPNDVVWRALLGACKNHNNFEMGVWVAKHLINLDSCNSSSYVLLSNLYAAFGMWSDVSTIRSMMKERDIRKIPGCSWIELEGVVHEFVVGDRSHPQVREIYSVLEKLSVYNAKCRHEC